MVRDKKNKVKETEPAKKYEKSTYGEYLTWNDGQRYEIIEGTVYNMTPAPYRRHQKVFGSLFGQFYTYLREQKCELYAAPFDVRLPEANEQDEEIETVVQPDLTVICDPDKLDKRGCRGAPDLIIEILSPGNEVRDKKIKRGLYEKHRVKEYWIVDYREEIVEIYKLRENNQYGKPYIYTKGDKVYPGLFSGNLEIDLELVFVE